MAATLLETTSVERGDATLNPLHLTIRFSHQQNFAYTQFTAEPRYANAFRDWIETLLAQPVAVSTELEPTPRGEATQAQAVRPQSSWERDCEAEPVLKLLAQIFDTDLLNTGRAKPPEEGEDEE